jgi:hypothetical protein
MADGWLTTLSSLAPDIDASDLLSALLGSLAGAYFGAASANKLAERGKLRGDLLKEIRNTSAAAILVYGIANRHLGAKAQFIKQLHDNFFEQREHLVQFLAAKEAGTVPPQQRFEYNEEYHDLKIFHAPIEQIERLVFEQVTLPGAIFLATQTLLGALQALNQCIEDRAKLIAQREVERKAGNQNPFSYFGLREGDTVDQRYMHCTTNIYEQNDDVIAYGIAVAEKLHTHALEKREEFEKEFGMKGPVISKLDFEHHKEFLPDPQKYKDAFKMFGASL